MAQITGGMVTFSRKVQVTQYEPKEARVELAFAVGEGEDVEHIFALASRLAHGRVFEMLGMKPDPNSIPQTAIKTTDLPKVAEQQKAIVETKPAEAKAEAPEEPKANRGGRPKKPPVQQITGLMAEHEANKANISTGENRADPSFPDEDEPSGNVAQFAADADAAADLEAAHADANGADLPDDDDLMMAAPAVITDKDLSDAITAKNRDVVNPAAIKAIIAQFAPFPKGAKDIPQESRQLFLDKLALVKKIGA